jgi:serine/threonine-protein kinase
VTDQLQTIGRYKILERVGRGAMGVLYRSIDPVLDREVAIKVMAEDFAEGADDDARTRFFREARAAARLQHRNIVTIFEFAEQDGVPYIVMEFLRGQSLAARMKQTPSLSVDRKLDIVVELATGLQFAHENGIVHRDVKPANVWLLEDGTVKLLDFGIAKASSTTLTRRGDVLGSAAYMAPEQISGGSIDGRADVFSATVVLYELLVGRRPFESDSPTSTILKIMQEAPAPIDPATLAELPPGLAEVTAKGLQKNPADRYQSAGELGDELQLLRLALQAAGETIFRDIDDTSFAHPPVDQARLVDPTLHRSAVRLTDSGSASAMPIRPLWLAGAAAAALLIAAGLWFRAARPASADAASPGIVAAAPAGQPAEPQVPTRPSGQPSTPALPTAPTPPSIIRVTSDPDGATVEIDGRDTGLTTPADVTVGDPPPGRIRLTKRGFQPVESRVTDTVLKAGSVTLRLQPAEAATVKVTATGSYPFEVVDGKRLLSPMATLHDLNVPSQRVLHLQAPSYLLDYPIKIDQAGGRTMQIQAPELGKLTIRSTMETCQVSVNGRDFGFPPINGQLIAAGTYSVQLRCPDGSTVRGGPVTVVAGQTLIAKVP